MAGGPTAGSERTRRCGRGELEDLRVELASARWTIAGRGGRALSLGSSRCSGGARTCRRRGGLRSSTRVLRLTRRLQGFRQIHLEVWVPRTCVLPLTCGFVAPSDERLTLFECVQ
jgi:hypothetical protein